MSESSNEAKHGSIGTRLGDFSRLVAPRRLPFDDDALFEVATAADLPDRLGDGKDAEENLFVPAGYTYLGQFVDHDLTLDTTSNLNPDDATKPTNLRTPAFDLDCVYGDGPSSQPYLYEELDGDRVLLRIGKTADERPGRREAEDDLPRNRNNQGKIDPEGRAIIGDKRNDENSIVAQIQLAFLKLHNRIVVALKAANPGLKGSALFAAARQELTWTYQRMLLEDYLPRIVEADVLGPFVAAWTEQGDGAYRLYPPALRDRIPIEFAGAAYRFGHSMVRTGYRLNTQTALRVFTFKGTNDESLTGFQPLPASHVIDDWGRFFPEPDLQALWPGRPVAENPGPDQVKIEGPDAGAPRPGVRLQFAYKIDPSLTGPLSDLPPRISDFDGGHPRPVKDYSGPSLALLNLRRGNKFALASGQRVAAALGADFDHLRPEELRMRTELDGGWTFVDVPEKLRASTPLWLYVLAEAQRKIVRHWLATGHGAPVDEAFFFKGQGALSQLGPVGGRIVTETFYGLLDADAGSVLNRAPSTWKPLVMQGVPAGAPLTFSRMLRWSGATISNGFGA